ncbi:MAG: helix-turn-helix domain-containing protein [Acidobacteriota bacterium]|nr:helix-turn-helix domain-containing protein [Acidobacteriota bacterium]
MISRLPAGTIIFTSREDHELLFYLANAAQRARLHDGLPQSRAINQLIHTLAATGHPDTPESTCRETEEAMGMAEVIGTNEAARLLGISPRQARRLAPRLDAHKVGGTYAIPATAINEHLKGKKEC